MVRHFFPWWWEDAYKTDAVMEDTLGEEERSLIARHGLRLEQIGFRRKIKAAFRGLARQEYPEDAMAERAVQTVPTLQWLRRTRARRRRKKSKPNSSRIFARPVYFVVRKARLPVRSLAARIFENVLN